MLLAVHSPAVAASYVPSTAPATTPAAAARQAQGWLSAEQRTVSPADARFLSAEWAKLNRALAPSGGIVTADALADLLRRHTGQGLSQVARWLVAGDLLSFRFLAQTQVPLFQFDLRSLSLRPGVQDLVTDTRGVFDGAELVRWFAEPNAWLGGALPADRVGLDAPAVLAAARADRFIATGWS